MDRTTDRVCNREVSLHCRRIEEFSKEFPGLKKLFDQDKPVYDLANTDRLFDQYRLTIWPIPVDDFANSGEGTFFKI